MSEFNHYANLYKTIAFARDERGILEMTFHTGGDSMRWGVLPHTEMADAFRNVAKDRENRVVILRGTGAEFIGPRASESPRFSAPPNAATWELEAYSEAIEMLNGLLDIAVPVVSAVNGPAFRHSELALLGDIVVASEDASFEDSAHFTLGSVVPGDGVHVVYTLLLGINRARHFLLTGRVITATEALDLGLVAEIVPKADVVARARVIAGELALKPDRLLRYTRALLVQPIKRAMLDYLALGLSVEGLAIMA